MNKKKVFIIGLILLIVAIFSVTALPIIMKNFVHFYLPEYTYTQIEFFLLFWCACSYLYSNKYYQYQIYSIVGVLTFYAVFIRFF